LISDMRNGKNRGFGNYQKGIGTRS